MEPSAQAAQPLCLTGSGDPGALDPCCNSLAFSDEVCRKFAGPKCCVPCSQSVVACLATETGTNTELASGKSEPRHPGDWPWTELSLNGQLTTR